MVSALILLNTEMGSEKRVLAQLKTISGVEEAHALYSVYDIAVKVNANSIEQLRDTITQDIKKIPETINFLTLLTVDKAPSTI
jgi:DNA-binding Lrp family transcriptional regulator